MLDGGDGAGVPVIASDIPGNRDLVTHGETGQIFPVGDASLLKDAIDAVLQPKFDRPSVQRAKELIDTRHSARSMAQAYERLFQSLAN
ncbi:MAG: glycosyltransferase [Sphingomonadales bacterium]|nr:glycosyltransferase [Sphingomonadales bacterium]